MSRGVNKVILVGNLGADPDMQTLPSGSIVAEFSLATNRKYTTREGVLEEETEWHLVKTWNKTAEFVGKHLAKGSLVYVEGRSSTRTWDDKDGSKRYRTEIVAQAVEGLGRGPGNPADQDDDLPF